MHNVTLFNDLVVDGFNLYERCNINFYLQEMGVYTQTLSGVLNFGTNLIMTVFVDADGSFKPTYNKLISDDSASVATGFGELLKKMFQKEIPDADLEQGKFYENASRVIIPVV